MKALVASLLFCLFCVTGCAFLTPENDQVLVRVSNQTGVVLDNVLLDLGESEAAKVRFQNVAPGSETPFREVKDAFVAYVARVQASGREYSFQMTTLFAEPLEPGHYTYVLSKDEEFGLVMSPPRDDL